MCGIAGFFGYGNSSKVDIRKTAKAMAAAMAHRGPDDEGIWSDANTEITLVHRRLAIIDLSQKGRQPMQSASGRYWLIYNGEAYNHLDLRAKLEAEGEAPEWRGDSDTETLLACIDNWGLEKTLKTTTGMFALALWDTHKRTLSLARDRMGEKPLYYGEAEGVFLFASELGPITKHPAFEARIDPNSIAMLMRYYYIPAPMSIYQGIKKHEPGRILTIERVGGRFKYDECAYWKLADAVNAGHEHPLEGEEGGLVDGLEERLRRAVGQQTVADVPVGAFLSGGVDSSLIVALMQATGSRPVNTYSIGFDAGDGFVDEAPHAKAVAEHLGTDHTEMYVSAKEAREVIPDLPNVYDEPFADSSQIPTALLARLTRRHVTVALSGDGGDELFGGYDRYPYAMKVHNALARIPGPLRKMLAAASNTVPWGGIEMLSGHAVNRLIGKGANRGLAYKMAKLNRALTAKTPAEFYDAFIVQWLDAAEAVPSSDAGVSQVMAVPGLKDGMSFMRQMLALDMYRYLPDDLLVKVDRAAMAASLETRVPMLDHSVVEFAQKVPDDMKIRNGEKKYLLKQLLYRHVPRELIDRPKRGFGAPIESWLKGGLRDWAEALLAPDRIRAQGHFNDKVITRRWNESLSGKQDWLAHLWPVLMFQAWEEGR